LKLTIVIPAYNEAKTLAEVVGRVRAVDLEGIDREILIVDDGSTDGTAEVAARLEGADLRLIRMAKNSGKGAALRRGFEAATGDLIIVQDADLEYDPGEYPKLLAPLRSGAADVVYGSRIVGENAKSYLVYYWGGRALTLVFNLLYGGRLTDLTTCYKAFRREDALGLGLESDGFEFCEEITAKLLLRGLRIVEVPISYSPRSFEAGKKIGWKDGFMALWTMFRLRFARRARTS